MRSKYLTFILVLAAVFAFGLFIGYALKPSVDVRVCDPADLKPAPPMYDPNDPAYEQLENDPVVGPALKELGVMRNLKGYQPLGKIGPFVAHVNLRTGDYLIGEEDGRQTVLMQETTDGHRKLTLVGRCQETWVSLTYDETTGKRIRAIFETNEEGGRSAPSKWIYYDDDADGRFDTMVDCEGRVAYEQKGLEWIAIRNAPEDKGP
jgi:hypothetical protein